MINLNTFYLLQKNFNIQFLFKVHNQEIRKDELFLFMCLYFNKCNESLYAAVISFHPGFSCLKSYEYSGRTTKLLIRGTNLFAGEEEVNLLPKPAWL